LNRQLHGITISLCGVAQYIHSILVLFPKKLNEKTSTASVESIEAQHPQPPYFFKAIAAMC